MKYTQAKTIQQILQPQNQPFEDVIVDLHCTTANMGLSPIFCDMHPFLLRLGAYLSSINPMVKVFIILSLAEMAAWQDL